MSNTNICKHVTIAGCALLLGLTLSLGCFGPRYEDGVKCGYGGTCPPGLLCDQIDNRCRAEVLPTPEPTCDDDLRNSDESDVDCGGSCMPCDNGLRCEQPQDCVSQVCFGMVCAASMCGDGVLNGDEECDSGGESADCDSDCTSAMCGDAVLNGQAGEECDDGNGDNSDMCVIGCVQARCGDGFVLAGTEECDDGNTDNGDACIDTCHAASCSDGYHNADELDIDCGGHCGPASCSDGQSCASDGDCVYGTCPAGVCVPPASCASILAAGLSTGDGVYTIDPDGVGGGTGFEVFCDMTTEGGGWTRFNWLEQAYPAGEDPLGQALSECAVADAICRGRIPSMATPGELLIRDMTDGEYARWQFNGSVISDAVVAALRDKVEYCGSNQGVFDPTVSTSSEVYCGNGGEGGCDSFYYTSGSCLGLGSWGLHWDGDTAWCSAAVKLGATSGGCGNAGDYGFLNDCDCNDESGALFYR